MILEGEITSDLTLNAADKNYMKGFVYVKPGVTLTIEAGTVIKVYLFLPVKRLPL